MPETKGGDNACLRCEAFTRGTQVQGFAQPHQALMLVQHRVHAVQGAVGGQQPGPQHLGEPDDLECGGAALGVPGQGLLGHHKQRVALAAPHGGGEAFVQVGLVGVVGGGGGVVLGDHAHLVRIHAQSVQRLGQAGNFPTLRGTQGTQARRGDGSVRAVGKGFCESHHAEDGKSEVGGDGAAGEQDGAATCGFDESGAASIVGA